MPAPDDVLALLVASAALSFAFPMAFELFVAWYSGVDGALQYSVMQCSLFAVSAGIAGTALASLF